MIPMLLRRSNKTTYGGIPQKRCRAALTMDNIVTFNQIIVCLDLRQNKYGITCMRIRIILKKNALKRLLVFNLNITSSDMF